MANFRFHQISNTKKIRHISKIFKNSSFIVFLHGFMSDLEGEKPNAFLKFAKEKRKFCDDEYLDFDKATDYLNTDKSNSIKGINNFNATKLGEWTTYKIGIRNSKKEDGFVKVYKDNQLIMDYKGVTFKWKGNYIGTIIRLGPYRDTDPSGKGYPPQSIHYDDFTIVSDKKTLDKYLN